MAWERRPKGHSYGYYYKSVRTHKGVRKKYYGRGEAGHEEAAAVQARQDARDVARRQIAAERQECAEADRLADELEAWANFFLTSLLITAGYHYHRGTWRRKR